MSETITDASGELDVSESMVGGAAEGGSVEPAQKALRSRITTKLLQPVDWQEKSLCTEVDPAIFFPERGGSSKAAREVCGSCEVAVKCLEYAINNKEQFGIWGGTSERERRKIRRERAAEKLRVKETAA